MRENSSSGNLRDLCAEDRGVPVSPSSDVEIRMIRKQFPQDNLIVAACNTSGENYQVEPVRFYLEIKTFMPQKEFLWKIIEMMKVQRPDFFRIFWRLKNL